MMYSPFEAFTWPVSLSNNFKTNKMKTFKVPTKDEVSEANASIFTAIKGKVGMVPNIYAVMANSELALQKFMSFSGVGSSFTTKEEELISLVVSSINKCEYCQSAHAMLAQNAGFSKEEISQILKLSNVSDERFNVLVQVTSEIVNNRGKLTEESSTLFYTIGYTQENLIDLALLINQNSITNYVHNLTDVAIDFPIFKH